MKSCLSKFSTVPNPQYIGLIVINNREQSPFSMAGGAEFAASPFLLIAVLEDQAATVNN